MKPGQQGAKTQTKESTARIKYKVCSQEEGVISSLDWRSNRLGNPEELQGEEAFETASEDDTAEPTAKQHSRQGQCKQRHRGLGVGLSTGQLHRMGSEIEH